MSRTPRWPYEVREILHVCGHTTPHTITGMSKTVDKKAAILARWSCWPCARVQIQRRLQEAREAAAAVSDAARNV